jgi:hypothetical protein
MAPACSTHLVAHLSAEFSIGSDLGSGLDQSGLGQATAKAGTTAASVR